jgi:hypothetical protein
MELDQLLKPEWNPPLQQTDAMKFTTLCKELQKSEARGIYWKPGWDEFFWRIGRLEKLFERWLHEKWVQPEVYARTKDFKNDENANLAALSVRFKALPMESIIKAGNLRLLHTMRNLDSSATFYAAKWGKLECMKLFHELGIAWHDQTIPAASQFGDLECLQYAHRNGALWHEETTLIAAYAGHLDCLRYVHENGAPWHDKTTLTASFNGHVECLRYAHEHGARWHEETTYYAACNGQLECLRYAHESNSEWHPATAQAASFYGNIECMAYVFYHTSLI